MDDKLRMIVEDPALTKLLSLIRYKYRSLGKVGGSVSLADFSPDEIEAIAGFTGISPDQLTLKRLTLKQFEQALSDTVFGGIPLPEFLGHVYGAPVTTRQEEMEQALEAEASFFRKLHETMPEGVFWWNRLESKTPDTRWIHALYREDPMKLATQLDIVFSACQQLPKEGDTELLPFFAQRTTGNPHAFDSGKTFGKLLAHCLFSRTADSPDIGMPRSTGSLNELFERFGLMRDDLWSFVTCRGLIGSTKEGPHPLWLAAASTDTVLNVPVKLLREIKFVRPAAGQNVWVVENSGVCSALVDLVPKLPVLCTHGQFRSAAWILLDLLAQEDVTFHYSGDFDPEGLQIAQRLIDRYPGHVNLWRMDADSYHSVISDEDITGRLAKLDGLTEPALVSLAGELRRSSKAGYQEGLTGQLAKDMKS